MAAVGKLALLVVLLLFVSTGEVRGQVNDTLATEIATKMMAAGFSNIIEVIDSADLFKEIAAFVGKGGKVTAFLPKNNYFSDHVDTGLLKYLSENKAVLRQVLKFHVVPNYALKDDRRAVSAPFVPFADGASYSTFNEKSSLTLTFEGTKRLVEGSYIKFPDAVVYGKSFVVHGINGLLIPKDVLPKIPITKESCKSSGTCPTTLAPGPSMPPVPSATSPAAAPALAPMVSPPVASPPLPSALAPAPAPPVPTDVNIIIAALLAAGYTSLAQLMVSSDLVRQYADSLLPGPVTLLAPDNAALQPIMTPNFTQTARSSPVPVQAVLDLHIVASVYVTYKIINGDLNYQSKSGATLYFKYNSTSETATVGVTPESSASTATIYPTPILDNGRISVLGINKVLLQGSTVPPPQSPGVRLSHGFAFAVATILSSLMI